ISSPSNILLVCNGGRPSERLLSRRGQANSGGVCSRLEDEVVFEPPAFAVPGEVNAGVDVLEEHPAIGRNARPPSLGLVADEVVGDPGQRPSWLPFDLSRAQDGQLVDARRFSAGSPSKACQARGRQGEGGVRSEGR